MNKYNFNPLKYQNQLSKLIIDLKASKDFSQKTYHQLIKKYPKSKSGSFSKSEIIAGIRHFSTKDQDLLIKKIVLKPIRTLSGVVPVTLLTKPYPCPGKCIFCPNDLKMPKSYLSSEPGAQRASHHHFDPYHQVTARLNAYYANGHPTSKVELIVLGGTWSVYPQSYKIWFINRCFQALNDFITTDKDNPCQPDTTKATWAQLKESQKINETAKTRCVGLSLETRPDFITKQELINFRKLGCTKVQIGVQSLDDKILKLNQRGHTLKATKTAFKLLRLFGFKIQAHWMANLYGSSVTKDIKDFKKLFSNPSYRPDELKIYPTALLKTAKLMDFYNQKLWKPNTNQELITILTSIMPSIPCYCRVSRMIRDFSSKDIVAGSKTSNLRQIIEKKANKKIKEIRSREIRQLHLDPSTLKLVTTSYKTSSSTEKFIEYITPENKIVAFLRLSLPSQSPPIKELKKSSIIREIHVYGQSLNLGDKAKTQHLGLGTNLINQAKNITKKEKYTNMAVISAIGTKEYYTKQGFKDGEIYQHIKIN